LEAREIEEEVCREMTTYTPPFSFCIQMGVITMAGGTNYGPF